MDGFRTPDQIAEEAVIAGERKARLSADRTFVGAVLAGAYIGFAGVVAIAVSSGLNAATWGTLPTLFTGFVFVLGLVLVVVAGSELLTGNMMLLPIAGMRKRIGLGLLARNWAIVTVGNLLGSLLVAYFLAVKAGVIGGAHAEHGSAAALTYARLAAIAKGKAITETNFQIFLRAIGCNWLVCLAVWMSLGARDIGGKILAIFFPIMAFVAIGFDHVVANMFFLPAAMFDHVPHITIGRVVNNLVLAFAGNAIGASVFVAGAYWFVYLRGKPAPDAVPAPEVGAQSA